VGFAFCLFQRKEGRGFGISIKKKIKKIWKFVSFIDVKPWIIGGLTRKIIIPIKFLVEQKKILTWIWFTQAFNGVINLINPTELIIIIIIKILLF